MTVCSVRSHDLDVGWGARLLLPTFERFCNQLLTRFCLCPTDGNVEWSSWMDFD